MQICKFFLCFSNSHVYRNEEFQEQLWEISVTAVKDYLSPEVLEKYGSRTPPAATQNVVSEDTQAESADHTTSTPEQTAGEDASAPSQPQAA